MKRLKKWIAIALGATTLLCTCACAPQGETDGPVSDVGNGEYVAPITPDTIVHAGGAYKLDAGKTIGFLSSEIETTSEGATVEGVTVQLTATVEPADAWNKEVDWSFAWADDAPTEWSSKPAENYIKIEPLTDGSTTANVTLTDYYHSCAITITVTTRDGGFTSSCDATCVSEYYETKITMDGSIAGTDRLGHQYYELYSGNTLNFTFKHYNKFGYEYTGAPGGDGNLFANFLLYGMFNSSGSIFSNSTIAYRYYADPEENLYGCLTYLIYGQTPEDGRTEQVYAFYSSYYPKDKTAADYLTITIDPYLKTGKISYFKPFDSDYCFGTSSYIYWFEEMEIPESENNFHTGGLELSIDTDYMEGEITYIKLRTSVSAVSLSSKYLQLK